MKRFLTSILIVSAMLMGCSSDIVDDRIKVEGDTEPQYGAKPTELSVLQINLWYQTTKVEDGFDALIDHIVYLDPDIVTMCELTDPAFPEQVTAALQERGIKTWGSAVSTSDGTRGVISKYPITESHTINDYVYKTVINANGQRIAAYAAHLYFSYYGCYYPRGYNIGIGGDWNKLPGGPVTDVPYILEQNRLAGRNQAIESFITNAEFELEKGSIVILGGDFNEPSWLDWVESTKNQYDHNGCVIEWEATKLLAQAGYTDGYRSFYPNPVTHPGLSFPSNNEDAEEELTWAPEADERDRIDFVFHAGEGVSVKNAVMVGPSTSIVRGAVQEENTSDTFVMAPGAKWFSDHKGVLIEYTISY